MVKVNKRAAGGEMGNKRQGRSDSDISVPTACQRIRGCRKRSAPRQRRGGSAEENAACSHDIPVSAPRPHAFVLVFQREVISLPSLRHGHVFVRPG